MVLGGLGRDEQARGDLGVRQTEADQLEHLLLADAQRRRDVVRSLRSSTPRVAEAAQQRRGPISVRVRAEPFEARQRRSGLGDGRRLVAGSGENLGQLETQRGEQQRSFVAVELAIALSKHDDRSGIVADRRRAHGRAPR